MPSAQELLLSLDERQSETFTLDALYSRMDSWRTRRDKIAKVDAFLDGDWTVEYPDGTKRVKRPLVENLPRTTTEDYARKCAEFLPTLRVEPARDNGQKRAQLRLQVISYYWQNAKLQLRLPYVFADVMVCGYGALKVWPDFSKAPEKRFPVYSRLDPRSVLLPVNYQAGDELTDIITTRSVKWRDLKVAYPDAAMRFQTRNLKPTDELTVVCFYDRNVVMEVATVGGQGSGPIASVLYRAANEAGCVPVVPILRPTAKGNIAGAFDDSLDGMALENRVVQQIADHIDQTVSAPPYSKNYNGPKHFGPDSWFDLPPDGEIGRVQPASIQGAVFGFAEFQNRYNRRNVVMPAARAGEVENSIASGAFVESILGPFATVARTLHNLAEVALESANEVAQSQDRSWCNARKSIKGYANGDLFKTDYLPSEDLADGDFSSVVDYGLGAGTDSFNREIRISRRMEMGLISRKETRAQLEGVENALKMEREINRERILDAVLSGIQQQAATGNFAPAAEYNRAVAEGEDPMDYLDEITRLSVPLAPQGQGTPTSVAPADIQAASASRGGNPLNEDSPLNAPALPSLDALRIA